MQLRNKRYMTIKVGGRKLKKGHTMTVNSSDITSRLQSLIRRGYFQLLESVQEPVLANNTEPDEDLPDTDPAPPVPPTLPPAPVQEENIKVEEIKEDQPVASKEDRPKITKRRRKKSQPKS